MVYYAMSYKVIGHKNWVNKSGLVSMGKKTIWTNEKVMSPTKEPNALLLHKLPTNGMW